MAATEDRLIESLTMPRRSRGSRRNAARLRLGIGDDAAIVALGRNRDWAISCDGFIEGIHFLARTDPPDSVGYKSLVRATSDLAAMGALPRFFFLTLALPESYTGRWFGAFQRGLGRASRELRIQIAGGDTTRAPTVCISITVLGEVAEGQAITRSGARPGDLIFVTGRLGRAALGLELLHRRSGRSKQIQELIHPHFYPRIHVALGAWLAQHRIASSMMDISDGLSTDLSRLCAASRVGARVNSRSLPTVKLSAAQSRSLKGLSFHPVNLALHGGDDYGLLFTVPRKRAAQLRRAPEFQNITQIGEIVRGHKILIVDSAGRARVLKPLGWDSFRKVSSKKSR